MVINKDSAKKSSHYQVMEYDFENEKENCIVEKRENMPIRDGLILEPIVGMLSVYFHIDDEMKFDFHNSINLNKDEFKKHTFA